MGGIIKKRVLEMDVVRVVSIVAVIVLHVSAIVLYRCTPYSTTYDITFFFNQLSRFSVPAFIAVSGMNAGTENLEIIKRIPVIQSL